MDKKRKEGLPAGRQGFTLIEILVVIGLIAILAAIVLIAINPARQFAQARNTQRTSNVETIMNALGQYLADNKGVALTTTSCTGLTTAIGSRTASTSVGTGGSNLGACLGTYIATGIPMDPVGGTADNTGYDISVDSIGRYMVCADGYNEAALNNPGAYCLIR
ncbi:MAG: hypothetical protein UY70_C0021G0008 [Candidatus Kaiserbacteria bacterium GW2011_GWB1_52_6]|uniref:Uncharacterized protein n=3 Tax=Candidatus Kaiseribacteriota TaxID=1752734 RepID=A0A0G1XKV6_9BACT|nr:MAG: hypothetical protein UY67_C0015G0008 [Candidatus Kaiserbacteria bacterium GW2011_GWA2_52_12]KKW26608.1 MAG: hypothetical protein UY70_C0021G0008 [Candidatus Kaiserbacteria bacterium GW2011_GWB1_52_6]KKW31893.1 MAG: hypothetical protein UY74_C0004G0013 [Candidatus Kaiserbacteria bacterium GW2011_GWC2_52_8b]